MIIRTQSDRQAFIDRASTIDLSKNVWVFTADKYKVDRSAAQNKLSFKWYAELGKQSGNGKEHERNYAKFSYGCPILIENDGAGDFTAFYEHLINSFDYEHCLGAMEFVQITSLMKVKQFAEYLNHIELYGVEHGYQLTKPLDEYDLAMGLTRTKTEGK